MDGQNGSDGLKLVVTFDERTQMLNLQFDPKQYRTWDFVVAVLEMARTKAEDARRMAMMQLMAEQSQDQALKHRLLRGH